MCNTTGGTRYKAVDNGYEITGSRETFNRSLYGSHANDDLQERFITFAGDLPVVMGVVTDCSKQMSGATGIYAKSGVLMSGLASTPGKQTPFFVARNADLSSRWFHQAEDVTAIFRNGWMEYESRQFSPWAAKVRINMTVLPLLPEDGFLVRYRIETDQYVVFCAGFGGLSDFLGRFEHAEAEVRNFHASDCRDNRIVCGKNRALVKGPRGDSMWIGASFPAEFGMGSACALQDCGPGMFLASHAENQTSPVVKLSAPIHPGEIFEGFLVAVHNQDEAILDKWLRQVDPVRDLKQQIHRKRAMITACTPDHELNQTLPSTALGMDASWHGKTFYHGAVGDHAPFLGWRGWYGATVSGWHDRVETAFRSHFSEIPKQVHGKEEKVWYDGKDRPELDHEGTQYHHLMNSYGFIPCILGRIDIYNMQEVAVDMLMHHLEWTGDLKFAEEIFDGLSGVLAWEERILDPDGDGLYQNFLNTWVSDGHSYNGGGCAQASANNYRANRMMEKLALKLNRPGNIFAARAARILNAVQEKLWLREKGVIAEYVDTIGNQLVHPSPELSTIYLTIDSGLADMFQAYRMFRFTETDLCNEKTSGGGRLAYSSNWLPKKYSTCGLFPAENSHLALVCFQMGLKEKGWEILKGIRDSYFSGRNPGLSTHILTGNGWSDGGDWDFSDVSGTYLRLFVEGLFGIRFRLLDNRIEISPGFPSEWTHAGLRQKDICFDYFRDGTRESFRVSCESKAVKRFKIAMRSAESEAVFLNGEPAEYRVESGIGHSFIIVETEASGLIHLEVIHSCAPVPAIVMNGLTVLSGNEFEAEVSDGMILESMDTAGVLGKMEILNNKIYARPKDLPGNYTLFLHVKSKEFDAWLPVDFTVERKKSIPKPAWKNDNDFEPLDISSFFNMSLTELHKQEFRSPRPSGYSIGVRLNGRYAWEWNHCGHNAVEIDDSGLRNSGGIFRSPSGIRFFTPENGPNVACASIWDNFPTLLRIPLSGKAAEVALLFIGVTNAMQSRVENVRITVFYGDESCEKISLFHPDGFDDWLVPSLQTEGEPVYFSNYNHAILRKIQLDPDKELAGIVFESIANEVIIGLLGISVRNIK